MPRIMGGPLTNSKVNMAGNADLTAVFDGDSTALIGALKNATDALDNFEQGAGQSLQRLDALFQNGFGNLERAVAGAKTALATVAPVAIFNFLHNEVQKGIDEFKKIGDEADKASVSTTFFQVLGYQANAANVSFDKVKTGIQSFAVELGKLKNGEGELEKNFKSANEALLAQLKGAKDAEAGVRIMAGAIAKLKDPFAQAKLAGEAFGKSNADIFRVLNAGSDGFRRAGEEAKAYNSIIDENVIRHSQDIKSGFAQLSNVIDLQFKQALLNISPLIKEIGQDMLGLSGAIRLTYDAFASLEGVTSTGLEERIKSVSQTLMAQRDAIKRIESGSEGALDHNVISDFIFGTNEEQLGRLKANAESTLALLNRLNAEHDKRSAASRTAPLDVPAAEETKDDGSAARKLLEGQRDMDELYKRLATDEHRYYVAIQMDAEKDIQRFKLDLEQKKITQDQYNIAMVAINRDMYAKMQAEQDKLSTTLKASMEGLKSEFEKVFSSWQSGHAMTFQAIERDFAQMVEKTVLKSAILEPLFGTGKAGSNEFGLIGGGIQSLFGTGGMSGSLSSGLSSAGSSLKGIFSGIFHEGGVVGEGGPGRWVDSGVFAGAHRYHQGGIAGLMPGEVPAILQQGEGIVPTSRMQNGASGGGHTFNVNIQTPNPQGFADSQGQIAAQLSQAVARGQRNL